MNAASHKQTVLIVDDMRANILALADVLKTEWHVKIAMDGANALRIAAAEPSPDIILLDIRMPGMDGYEVCRRLKQSAATKDIPVVFITAMNEDKDEAYGLSLGAIDYIIKPFSSPLVKARVKNHLQVQRLSDEYEKVFNGTQDAMVLVALDADGSFRYIRSNLSHQLRTGKTLSEIKDKTPCDVFGAAAGAAFTARCTRCFQERTPLLYEENVLLPEGERIWLTNLTPVIEKGKAVYVVGSSTDITERKQAERALAQAKQREQEFESRIEETMLRGVKPSAVRGAEVAALTIPALHMCGDFVEFFRFDDDCFDFVIGDVMGKGIQAALVGAGAKSWFLRALGALTFQGSASVAASGSARYAPPSPADIVGFVDVAMGQQLISLEQFITLCYVRFDLRNRVLDIVGCGHTKVIVRRAASGKCDLIAGENMPLGFVPEQSIKSMIVQLQPDDVLLFYSDGLTEARSADGQMFGEERMVSLLESMPGEVSAAAVTTGIHSQVTAFTGGKGFDDDFTCIAVRIDPPCRFEKQVTLPGRLDQLSKLRDLIGEIVRAARSSAVEEDEMMLLEVAVQEAFVNVVEHEFKDKERPITVEGVVTDSWLRIRLRFVGRCFNPNKYDVPDFDGDGDHCLSERGRGIHIINLVMDEYVSEQIDSNQVCVTMTKKHRHRKES